VALLLLGQALPQGLHQLFPAAERFDAGLFLVGQEFFGQLAEPFLRDLRRQLVSDIRRAHHALEYLAEYLVEPVEVTFVFYETGAAQIVEILDAVVGDSFLHRRHQRQIFLEADRNARAAQLIEQGRKHSLLPSTGDLGRQRARAKPRYQAAVARKPSSTV
jgi:hypothetical protein